MTYFRDRLIWKNRLVGWIALAALLVYALPPRIEFCFCSNCTCSSNLSHMLICGNGVCPLDQATGKFSTESAASADSNGCCCSVGTTKGCCRQKQKSCCSTQNVDSSSSCETSQAVSVDRPDTDCSCVKESPAPAFSSDHRTTFPLRFSLIIPVDSGHALIPSSVGWFGHLGGLSITPPSLRLHLLLQVLLN